MTPSLAVVPLLVESAGAAIWSVAERPGNPFRLAQVRNPYLAVFETSDGARALVSAAIFDGAAWIHASVSRPDRIPSYEDLKALHALAFGEEGWSYQVFAAAERWVDIHPRCLHLWGRLDGANPLPDFGAGGSI